MPVLSWFCLGSCYLSNAFKVIPCFAFIRFRTSCFMLRPLIYSDLSSIQCDRNTSSCILLHADIKLDQHHLLEMFSSFHCLFLNSLLKLRCPQVCGFRPRSLIHFHWITFLFLCQYHAVLLLQLYSTSWNQGWWNFQNFSFCVGLF